MKKIALFALLVTIAMPQAFGVAVYWNDGSDVSGWIAASGEWESVDGMITRTNIQAGGTTHALVLDDVIDMTSVTFPVVLTYDVMVEADAEGEGEVWTGIGIGSPSADAGNIEDGAVVVALRDNGGNKGLHVLVGGRQWANQTNAFDRQPGTVYTVRVQLSNPNFNTNQVDIDASVHEKGGEDGTTISLDAVPASGNAFVLSQTGLTLFSRSSAEGKGGSRSFDNIVLEAASIPGAMVAYQNDGSDASAFTQVSGTFESVDGAIVRTDAVAPNTTQGAMIDGVASMVGNQTVSLSYDIKVETITTATDETWSGIALFSPAPDAGNIEDGAVIMTVRDGGFGSDQGRGLHALLGGRAWLQRNPNLLWKADTWYHMTVTVTNANVEAGTADVIATLSENEGSGAVSVILLNAPSGNRYELTQSGIALFSRSGGAAEGGMRSYDNIMVQTVAGTSNVNQYNLFK